MLSLMTVAAPPSSSRATTISIVRFETKARLSSSAFFSCMANLTSMLATVRSVGRVPGVTTVAPGTAPSLAGGQEPGLLHQLVVELVVGFDPGLELVAGHEGLVEGALLHELLPVVRRQDLL